MEQKRRMANIELLRILAMVMVVIMHFLTYGNGLLELGQPLSGIRLMGTLLEMCCISAVNVYVLISGYFGIEGSYKPGKTIRMLFQVWFYALLIPVVLGLAGVETLGSARGVYGWIEYLFPIETEHYWFATAYIMLYLVSPLLNKAAGSMTKKQYRLTLLGLLILFSGIKSISPVVFAFDKFGYDLPWFICVYLIGGYLKLHADGRWIKRGWLIYAFSSLACFGVNVSMWFLAQKWDSFSYYFTVPYHYNYILCLLGSVGLFYGFMQIRVGEGTGTRLIRKMGTLCFGVYLFHEHVDIRGRWYDFLHPAFATLGNGPAGFFLELIICVALLFAAGMFIDWIRSLLFSLAGKGLSRTKIAQKVRELDGTFREG